MCFRNCCFFSSAIFKLMSTVCFTLVFRLFSSLCDVILLWPMNWFYFVFMIGPSPCPTSPLWLFQPAWESIHAAFWDRPLPEQTFFPHVYCLIRTPCLSPALHGVCVCFFDCMGLQYNNAASCSEAKSLQTEKPQAVRNKLACVSKSLHLSVDGCLGSTALFCHF